MQIYLFLLNYVIYTKAMIKYFSFLFFFFITSNSFSQTYEQLVAKSVDYIETDNYIAAEQSLVAAMKKEPANQGNFLLLTNLGTVQRKLGKTQEALLSYTTALSRYPQNIFVLQNRAALFCEIDSLNGALNDYNIILAIDNENREALYRSGLIKLSQKKTIEAETNFEKILVKSPHDLDAAISLAFILKSREEWEKAEDKYTDLIYAHKGNADLYLNRAECYIRMSKLARASNDLAKAKELGCTDPMWSIMKGLLYVDQFDKHSAKLEFLKAQEQGVKKEVVDQYLLLCK